MFPQSCLRVGRILRLYVGLVSSKERKEQKFTLKDRDVKVVAPALETMLREAGHWPGPHIMHAMPMLSDDQLHEGAGPQPSLLIV